MSTTPDRKSAAYNSVIEDLYAKRAQLDQAIAALEALLQTELSPHGSSSGITTAAPNQDRPRQAFGHAADDIGGSLISAIKSVLRRSDRPLGNAEIYRELEASGVKFRSANPQLSVSQVLSRNSRLFGEPMRVGRGRWALR
jgi:hypothetical protein